MDNIIFKIEKEDPEFDIFKGSIPKNNFNISNQIETILSILTNKKCKVKIDSNKQEIKFEIRKEKE